MTAYTDQLTAETNAFAAAIEPERARWEYCLRVSTIKDADGQRRAYGGSRAACARVLGLSKRSAELTLTKLLNWGFDGVEARDAERDARFSRTIPGYTGRRSLDVGPLQPWLVGHVYFARLKALPHVVKIGFSRRVIDRLDDIERRAGEKIARPVVTRVGTAADEQWWHHNWRAHRISGEWFFDPKSADRSLPEFLQHEAIAA